MTSEERKKWQKEIKRQLRIVLVSSLVLALILAAGFVLSHYVFWGWRMSLTWIILFSASVVYIFLFRFATEGIFITQMEEGTGKVIMKLGQAHKGLIQYKDHALDLNSPDWDVIPGQEEHLLGGLRWVGLWPIYYIYKYNQRWTSVREDGEAVPHDEEIDSALLKEKIYYIKLEGAEDKDGIPVDVDILLTGQVVKLYRALFGPHNYLEQIINRTKPLFGEYMSQYGFMDLRKQKQRAGGELWEKLEKEGMVNVYDKNGKIEEIGEFERDYGFRVKDGGIEMVNITPPEEYQKAQTQKRVAETEADRIAGETIGAVISMMAISRGITIKEMQEETNNNKETKKEFMEFCKQTLHKKMAIDAGRYTKIEIDGADGAEKTLLDLIAAWLTIPRVGPVQKDKEEKDNQSGKETEEEKLKKTSDEVHKWRDEMERKQKNKTKK